MSARIAPPPGSPAGPPALAARQGLALAGLGPLRLQGGPADLLLRGEDGRLRLVLVLEPGSQLLPAPPGLELHLRARRALTLLPGLDPAAAQAWLEGLARLAAGLGLPPAAPQDSMAERSDQLLRAIAGALDAPPATSPVAQEEGFRATLAGYGALLRGRFHRAGAEAGDALSLAAAGLARLAGAKPVPVPRLPEEPVAEFLERFAAAHGLRLRRFQREPGATLDGEGPLLAFTAAAEGEATPLLLRPRPLGGHLVVPGSRLERPRRLDAGLLGALQPELFAFCRTLPQGRLRYRDLLGFGLQAATADLLLVAACGLAAALLAMLPPLASQQITNIAVHTADTAFLAQLLVALLVALLAETGFHAIGKLAELRAQGRAGLTLHAAMVDRLLRLQPADLRGNTSLILATEMETVEKLRRAVISGASAGLLALFQGLAAAALVAAISPQAGLIAIGMVALLVLLTALVGWLQFKAIYEGERMDVIVLAFVHDLIRLMPMLRGNRLERRAFTQWSENFLAFQSRLMRSARIGNALPVAEPLWEALLLAACFAALAYAGAASGLSAGAAVAFVMALGRLIRAGRGLAQATAGLIRLLPMAKLARPLLDFTVEPLQSGPPVPKLSGRIEAAGVSFFYGTRRALDQVSFAIADGEFVALAGPSGSGKSTLLSLLAGLQAPQSGRLLLDGHDLAGIGRRQLTRRLGLVLQNSRLFPGSIFENIRGAAAIGEEEAWHVAAQAGIADELKALPMGLRTPVTEAGAGFSQSQVQRILIARALAQSPAVLILDEAMSALDGAAQKRVMATLHGLKLTRIIVAHRPALWAETDRVLMLEGGALVANGPPRDVLSPPPQAAPP
ncbi:ATP-binding cassette domain-containing protein [Pseudoroseomonas cervicalis]|uniref:ATP-binding cassette domain-containing protein n=1 Tax=Teichococcus cervicalis TaxID=204525 RepID=UPI0027877517|nr:ATP-binding cassette domain-containing protein [Pseudoroseomonas cervicalis]MDQ1080075.1 ABC-type bacteriocin/lantibiotic exporter with double-glycine peptidase domain [Pseudoroseomonas cervicalis]